MNIVTTGTRLQVGDVLNGSVITEVRPPSIEWLTTVAVKIDGAWQVLPAEGRFEIVR